MLYDTFDLLNKIGADVDDKSGEINMDCPLCGGKKKFYIVRGGQKHGQFHCFGCEINGGSWQFFNEINNCNLNPDYESDQADLNMSILKYLNLTEAPIHIRKVPEGPKQAELAEITKRSALYQAVLDQCPFSDKHRMDLLERGFTNESIKENGYRTTPRNTNIIVSKILSKGHVPKGVPGFYTDNDVWKFAYQPTGILLPIRDENRLIQGLNNRVDEPIENNKYLYTTSLDKPNGTKAASVIHVRGTDFEEIVVTEGVIKADLAYQFLNTTVIAIMGSGIIAALLAFIDRHGVKRVRLALDMDFCRNKHVANHLKVLMSELDARGVYHSILTWHPKYKGIDNSLVARARSLAV